ncbi:MFS transporter [Actinomadura rugatobispora]|uniref:MFS transporter n=1 Tax=Actinomadura rugatobispora TaxID=1994 RepID=A0ABW0ZXQ7_9ACTN|nr:MFS transporter [Actinomadura rugatobispora]
MSEVSTSTDEDLHDASGKAWLALLVLALPTLLLSIDVSVLYLALPTLSRELGASSIEQLWIIDIYSFVLAGFLVTMGGLADRIGRRRLMLIGATAFGAASAVAGFAQSPEVLIGARAVLGIAGATLMPTTLATIRHLFAGTRQMSSAIGAWFACFMIGMLIGPIVGGIILDRFSWGVAFFIAIPVMVLLLIAAPVLLPESKDPSAGRIDLPSVALSLGALLPVAWGVKDLARDGASWTSIAATFVGLGFGVAFVARQRRLTDPLVDLALFGIRAFSGALAISAVGGIVMAGTSLVSAIYLQSVNDLDPLEVALWLIPQNVVMVVGFAAAPALAKLMPERYVIAGGLVVAAFGFSLLTQADADTFGFVIAGMAIASFGVAAPMSLGANVLMSSAPEERAGSAASIMETSGELGVALGIASLGSAAAAMYRVSLGSDLDDIGITGADASAASRGIEEALSTAANLPVGIGDALESAAKAAFVSSVHVVGVLAAVTFIVLAGAAVLTLAAKGSPTSDEPATTT